MSNPRSPCRNTTPLGSQEAGVYAEQGERYEPIFSEFAARLLERIEQGGEMVEVQQMLIRLGRIASDASTLTFFLGMAAGDQERGSMSLAEQGARYMLSSKQAAHQRLCESCRKLEHAQMGDIADLLREFYARADT